MDEVWKIAIGLTGLSGVAAFVFLSLYKEWINAPVLSDLTRKQKYNLRRLFLVLTFGFAIFALVTATYQKEQDIKGEGIAAKAFYEAEMARYELGKKLFREKLEDASLAGAEREELKKIADDYGLAVDAASDALKRSSMDLWYERTKQIHKLLESKAAQRFLPDEFKVWDIVRQPPAVNEVPS